MTLPPDLTLTQLCSHRNEAQFFATLGHFFACPKVRRDCGGYPLNDGPLYRWFVIRRNANAPVLAFASVQPQGTTLHWREAYVTPEARQQGLFRALRQRVLDHADQHHLDCTTRVRDAHAPRLLPYGFNVLGARGKWITLQRKYHDQ